MDTIQPSEDRFAAELRGTGPAAIIAVALVLLIGNIVLLNIIVIPAGAILVLIWVYITKTPWADIGYARPQSWLVTITGGILFGAVFKLLMKAIVMPLLGADPVNQAYHFLSDNKSLLPFAILAMLVAGFGEETVFRGFLFERLHKFFGNGPIAKISIVLITSVLFGFGHYFTQGWAGVEQALMTGFVFGCIFAITKNIWFVMIAHAAFDLVALIIIYKDLELQIAHWIVK